MMTRTETARAVPVAKPEYSNISSDTNSLVLLHIIYMVNAERSHVKLMLLEHGPV